MGLNHPQPGNFALYISDSPRKYPSDERGSLLTSLFFAREPFYV